MDKVKKIEERIEREKAKELKMQQKKDEKEQRKLMKMAELELKREVKKRANERKMEEKRKAREEEKQRKALLKQVAGSKRKKTGSDKPTKPKPKKKKLAVNNSRCVNLRRSLEDELARQAEIASVKGHTGRKVNRKVFLQETNDFVRIMKSSMKSKCAQLSLARNLHKKMDIADDRKHHEDNIEKAKVIFGSREDSFRELAEELKASQKAAEMTHRSKQAEIRQILDKKAKEAAQEAEETDWKQFQVSYPFEGIKEFTVDESTVDCDIEKFPFPTKSLAKMAAEDVQDHLLTTWTFISQFGDVLGLFPRRQKNESDSETDDDLDEEQYNDEVATIAQPTTTTGENEVEFKERSKMSSDKQNSEE